MTSRGDKLMLFNNHRVARSVMACMALVFMLLAVSACTTDSAMPNDNGSVGNENTNGGDNGNENVSPADMDSDSDGVIDADDECPGTAPDSVVDETGCPDDGSGQPVPDDDADGDGVADDEDVCPNTVAGANVDDEGCSAAQRDGRDPPDRGNGNDNGNGNHNGNGNDNGDDPAGNENDNGNVNDNGNGNENDNSDDNGNDNGDVPNGNDNDNANENNNGTGNGNDNGNDNGGGGGGGGGNDNTNDNGSDPTGSCGNGVVEADEQCDPPDGVACDAECQRIEGSVPANDACANAYTVTNGTVRFSTADATTDGPEESLGACQDDEGDDIFADIWYVYEATCSGLATVSLCGSSYDTKAAVYFGAACPTQDNTANFCSDDNCGLNLESRITFAATEGDTYLIRIGGFGTAQGNGTLTIACGQNLTCQGTDGDCLSANGSRGCADTECCNLLCGAANGIDRYCCDVEWDEFCAGEAQGLCAGAFAACENGTGNCLEAQDGVGCDDQACCQQVCEADPFCCLVQWDDVCVSGSGDGLSGAAAFCVDPQEVCAAASGDCFTSGSAPGCASPSCCEAVCNIDAFCCGIEWDDACVTNASELCLEACADATGSCFGVHNDPGCNVPDCCTIICSETPECCLGSWGQTCVARANELRNEGQCGN